MVNIVDNVDLLFSFWRFAYLATFIKSYRTHHLLTSVTCIYVYQDIFKKADPKDSLISLYVYSIGQCFELRICLFYENTNFKKKCNSFVQEFQKLE